MTSRAIVTRLKILEAGKQRRHVPVLAFYDPNTEGSDRAEVERYIGEHGHRQATLLPCNGRRDR